MLVRCRSLMVVVGCFIFLMIFHRLVSLLGRDCSKYLTMIMGLSIFPSSSVDFCFMYFEGLLGAYTFSIIITFWWIDPFTITCYTSLTLATFVLWSLHFLKEKICIFLVPFFQFSRTTISGSHCAHWCNKLRKFLSPEFPREVLMTAENLSRLLSQRQIKVWDIGPKFAVMLKTNKHVLVSTEFFFFSQKLLQSWINRAGVNIGVKWLMWVGK